jgi:hypothetical protein
MEVCPLEERLEKEQWWLDHSVGVVNRCNAIRSEEQKKAFYKEWAEANKEALAYYKKAWAEENKERIKERKKTQYQANKEKIRESQKRYYELKKAK